MGKHSGPDSDQQFSYEALYKAKVDAERAGFTQCRDKVRAFTDMRMKNIREHPGPYAMYDAAQLDAFQAVLVFLSTHDTGQSPPA